MKLHRRSAVTMALSLALLGLTLTGTLAVSGCADPDKDRAEAEAQRQALLEAAQVQEDDHVPALETRAADLETQRGRARAAMDAAEVGGDAWNEAREAEAALAFDAAAVRSALAAARESVRLAREQAGKIAAALEAGDAVLVQDSEERAATAAGGVLAAFVPWAAPFVTLAGGLGVAWKKARAARVYRGERDRFKGVAETIVRSIDVAKAAVPELGQAFAKAAPVIDAGQRAETKLFVDAVQGKG